MPRLTHISTPSVQRLLYKPGTWCGLAIVALFTTGWGTVALSQSSPPTEASQDSPTAYPTISEGRIVRPTLRLGSQGDSVKELQSILVLLGFLNNPVSGVYQEDTATAVQRFQEAAGITPDGVVGPATWNSLLPVPAREGNPPTQATTTPDQSEATPVASTGNGTPPSPTTPPDTDSEPPNSSASTSPPATEQPSASRPILRPGMEGAAVQQLQEKLEALGVYSGPIDGIFGDQTEAAVRRVQTENSLEVDGIVGPSTWSVLD